MKKKILSLVLIICVLFSLSGCADIVDLKDEDSDVIAEYIASQLIKHSYRDQWGYQKLEFNNSVYNMSQTVLPDDSTSSSSGSVIDTSKPSQGGGGSSSSGSISTSGNVSADICKLMGIAGCSLELVNVFKGDKYPETEYVVSVPANPDCSIVAYEFKISNATGGVVSINTDTSKVDYVLTIGDKKLPMFKSLLKNDLSGIKDLTLASNDEATVVVLFQVSDSLISSLDSAVLNAYNDTTLIGKVN